MPYLIFRGCAKFWETWPTRQGIGCNEIVCVDAQFSCLTENQIPILFHANRIAAENRMINRTCRRPLPCSLVSPYERLAAALFPAVAVCGGRGSLQLAVVSLVADAGALCAAAERVRQAARATLENVLVDVFRAGPGEAAGVVAADDVERGAVGRAARGKDHGHQGLLLGLQVVGGLGSNLKREKSMKL